MIDLEEVINQTALRFPLQKHISNLYNDLDEEDKHTFSVLLNHISEVYNMTEDEMIDCYAMFVSDTLEESRYFFEHGHYRCATYQEANDYMLSKNAHYMRSYQIGLFLSLIVWPNHAAMRLHFRNCLKTNKCSGGGYLEAGVGHGYYFSEAVAHSDFAFYVGVDINADSLNMTSSVMEQRPECRHKRYELKLADFLELSPFAAGSDTANMGYSMIVAGEVLEHVQMPENFLRKIAEIANQETLIYVTTCINAPEVDHISLFEDPQQLRDLFEKNGLKIMGMEFFLYKNKPLEICLKRKWPITVAIRAKKCEIRETKEVIA